MMTVITFPDLVQSLISDYIISCIWK